MKRKFYFAAPVLALLIIASCFSGCTKNTIDVEINDMLTKTILSISPDATVEEALEEAEIIIGEKDKVEPEMSTFLSSVDTITISRYASVTVEYNGEVKQLSLVGGTVEQAVSESGFRIGKNDAVNYDGNAYLTDGMEIVITRLISVALKADGKTETVLTPACTVNEFLQSQGIELGKNDIVTPSLNTELKSDTKVVVKRVEKKTITETEKIEFSTVYKTSSSMKKGTSKVTQEGKDGEKTVKYRVTYIDGKESEREVIRETVTLQPVDKIVVQGTQAETTTSSGKTIVSKQRVENCDGSGHGYYVINWSDGTTTYEEF